MDTRAKASYAACWTTEGMSEEMAVTEAEWMACNRPEPMLEFLRGKTSDRRLRLFVVACCRNIWAYLPEEGSRRAVEVAERFADGLASREELAETHRRAHAVAVVSHSLGASAASDAAVEVWRRMPISVPHDASGEFANVSVGYGDDPSVDGRVWERAADQESRRQTILLRCIFGKSFVPVTISPAVPAWHNAVVVCLAQAAYEERHLPAGTLDSGRLAILADALEEAGCTDADILGHLREPGPHVRGCFAVDLCLGLT